MTTLAILGHFLHGLIFFTLGLTVHFLKYRSQRIQLARRLHWLGGFAFFEAFAAWNGLLITLTTDNPVWFQRLQPALMATGYTFLLAFGIQTRIPEEKSTYVKWIPVGLSLIWGIPYIFGLIWVHPAALEYRAEILLRYTFASLGGILTAVGLRQQSYQTLQPEMRVRIRQYLRLIEIMAAAYGICNLLLAPTTSHFLAAQLHMSALPPYAIEWLWSIVGLGLTLGWTRALTKVQQEIEQWIENVERSQALVEERERIGRELHDGTIQSIYASGLLLESVLPIIPNDPVRAQAQLGRVMDNLNETIQDVRRYIFNLRQDMPDDEVPSGIERLLRDFRINTLLETDLQVTGDVVQILSLERRRHIFQIVREALTNTARHARAQSVQIQLAYDAETLDITIIDDGIGMEKLQVGKGYGLRNIRERARLLDGTLRIESAPGAGVILHLSVPY